MRILSSDFSEATPATWSSELLRVLGDVACRWTPDVDAIEWEGNPRAVFPGLGTNMPKRAEEFRRLMTASDAIARDVQIAEARRTRTPAAFEFQMIFGAGQSCWVEERCAWIGEAPRDQLLSVLRVVTERHEREARLDYLASKDELTGHFNRSRLRERLAQALSNAQRHKVPCAYFTVGIDGLSRINEAYGFDIADELIVLVGQRLASTLRSGDAIGRVGGGKFGVILSECDDDDMQVAANRFLSLVRDEVFETAAGPVSATVSIGGTCLPGYARDTHDAMAFAEEALDQAKTSGRDTFVSYRASFQIESARKRNIVIAEQIVSALREDRLALAFQPIVRSATIETTMYECLVRMVRADGSLIPAAEFIPVAEQLGLVRMIDRRVAEIAVATLFDNPELHLSVNISGMTATDTVCLHQFLHLIRANRSVAQRLTVEITETIAIRDIEESVRFVSCLRDLGCRIAIDDFGAGYTSFQNLKMLTVDMVKIDGSYVRGIEANADNVVFIKALMTIAHAFKLDTVAEMVGNDAEAKILRDLGIDYFQGFHYGRPEMGEPWAAQPVAQSA